MSLTGMPTESTPVAAMAGVAARAPSNAHHSAITTAANKRDARIFMRPSIDSGELGGGFAPHGFGDQVADAQAPGVDRQGRIHAAHARQHAAVGDEQSLDAMHL